MSVLFSHLLTGLYLLQTSIIPAGINNSKVNIMSDRAAAADARRQKILARGKDRLSTITGGTSSSPTSNRPSGTTDSSEDPRTDGIVTSSSQLPGSPSVTDDVPSTSCLQPTVAGVTLTDPSTVMSTTFATAVDEGENDEGTTRTSTLHDLTSGVQTVPQRPPDASDHEGGNDNESLGAPDPLMMSSRNKRLPGVLGFGAKLQLAVKFTILPRAFLSIFIACLLSKGYLTPQLVGLPVLTLMALQVALIISFQTLLLSSGNGIASSWAGTVIMEEEGTYRLPPHLRQLQLTKLIPGLDDALESFKGVSNALSSVLDGVAVFILAYSALRII
ncbi:hypothetical protein CEUSTIGMA_g9264.t1 [Chlamydomonas eustigma]|uniref:ABC transmembrane type-1 domain-containing protein n=1 Tax=Chlamydomonas eustigma TaxID=1157962 RepID=A0A250XFM7_9CHLO|nr:hypothetical protein CEUSTIGMA_g9264.t1 [Chlamydomonas eustigma]|eukprot:GAX81836.1 hypothetical protein CEUSTIGMA_g9264.t1 [Chlamydomonas eustigma]